MNTRELILDLLLELAKSDMYSNVLIRAVLEKYDYLDGKEKAFIKRVSEGTIEYRIQIDYILDQFSKVPVKKMKPLIRELLRMSVYQILYMEHIPDSAICDEAVKLAKRRHFQSLQGYVNGVLRNIVRNKANVKYPDKETEREAYLSIRYSMPLWLVEHFDSSYGTERCEIILDAFTKREPLCARLEETMTQEACEELLATWEKAGAKVEKHPYLPYAVTLEKVEGVSSLKGYKEGCFTIQDVSSMLVVEAAGIKKQDTVMDVCASPGGKMLHASTKLDGTGNVMAFDVSEAKMARMEENCLRLHKENITIQVKDAREYDANLKEKADVLIADVPCSGIGVIGKKQDIKYRITKESLEEIVSLQKDIIKNVVRYVKPGGIMMYSTCTMNPTENEQMVQWICDKFGFRSVSMEDVMPKQLQEEAKKGYIQLLPGIHNTDGFFLAKLRKEG